jgi:hypothetical protein
MKKRSCLISTGIIMMHAFQIAIKIGRKERVVSNVWVEHSSNKRDGEQGRPSISPPPPGIK